MSDIHVLTRVIDDMEASDLLKAQLAMLVAALEDEVIDVAALAVLGKISVEQVRTKHPDEILDKAEAAVMGSLAESMSKTLLSRMKDYPEVAMAMAMIAGVLTGVQMERLGFKFGRGLTKQEEV